MKDSLLSSITGSGTALMGMITGLINVNTMMEVLIYGVIGGGAGLLGKWFVSIIKFYIEKRFKK